LTAFENEASCVVVVAAAAVVAAVVVAAAAVVEFLASAFLPEFVPSLFSRRKISTFRRGTRLNGKYPTKKLNYIKTFFRM
jgi:hypothetical protein